MGVYILLWSGWSSNLFGLLVDQRRVDRAVGSGGPFFFMPVIVFSLVFGWYVVYVGDASVTPT
jgi:hypothetical protein